MRALFAVLTAAFLLIGLFAAKAGVWPVAVAAVALGLWMGTLAAS
jgi:NhaP-type Na+/H+ and K+/H+ antiporter